MTSLRDRFGKYWNHRNSLLGIISTGTPPSLEYCFDAHGNATPESIKKQLDHCRDRMALARKTIREETMIEEFLTSDICLNFPKVSATDSDAIVKFSSDKKCSGEPDLSCPIGEKPSDDEKNDAREKSDLSCPIGEKPSDDEKNDAREKSDLSCPIGEKPSDDEKNDAREKSDPTGTFGEKASLGQLVTYSSSSSEGRQPPRKKQNVNKSPEYGSSHLIGDYMVAFSSSSNEAVLVSPKWQLNYSLSPEAEACSDLNLQEHERDDNMQERQDESNCFICKKSGPALFSCIVPDCTRFYHMSCLKTVLPEGEISTDFLVSCPVHTYQLKKLAPRVEYKTGDEENISSEQLQNQEVDKKVKMYFGSIPMLIQSGVLTAEACLAPEFQKALINSPLIITADGKIFELEKEHMAVINEFQEFAQNSKNTDPDQMTAEEGFDQLRKSFETASAGVLSIAAQEAQPAFIGTLAHLRESGFLCIEDDSNTGLDISQQVFLITADGAFVALHQQDVNAFYGAATLPSESKVNIPLNHDAAVSLKQCQFKEVTQAHISYYLCSFCKAFISEWFQFLCHVVDHYKKFAKEN